MKHLTKSDMTASSYCILHILYCIPRHMVNIRNTEVIYFLLCISAHTRKMNIHRERLSPFKKHFTELKRAISHFQSKKRCLSIYRKLKKRI